MQTVSDKFYFGTQNVNIYKFVFLSESHFLNIVLQLFNQLYTCTGPCIPMYYTCIAGT